MRPEPAGKLPPSNRSAPRTSLRSRHRGRLAVTSTDAGGADQRAATVLATVPPPFERRLSRLIAPAPKATIWSRPPAIITFLRKWIIWFWSAKLLWNVSAVTRENSASAVAAVRVWKPEARKRPPPNSTTTATARAKDGSGRRAAPILSVVGPIAASLLRPLMAKGRPINRRPAKGRYRVAFMAVTPLEDEIRR